MVLVGLFGPSKMGGSGSALDALQEFYFEPVFARNLRCYPLLVKGTGMGRFRPRTRFI